jgi:sodium-dependent dicarboxylate transporter 2/3/5
MAAATAMALGAWWQLGFDERIVLAAASWMAVWWVTEAVPIAVTALLPLVVFPATGVMTAADAASPYASHIIFLFLGGFVIAAAVETSDLHRRIALSIVARAGSSPRTTVLAFMVACAALSMWISNSATAIMMLPVALAVASRLEASSEPSGASRFRTALLLGIAYSASIGGVGTLVGSPPNLVFAAAAERLLGETVDFAGWLAVGVPLVIVLLPLAWLYLTRIAYPLPAGGAEAAQDHVRQELAGLGRATYRERAVAIVFAATALAWVFRSTKQLGSVTVPGLDQLLPGLQDSTIAIAGAVALFVLPDDRNSSKRLLDWSVATKIPWGVIILFGGGLSLAAAFQQSGLAETLARAVAEAGGLGLVGTVAVVVAATVAMTELTSNTATAAMLMPLLAAAAVASGYHPYALMIPAAVACSFAFCLPVATPPNAVVFSSGHITMRQMALAGLAMNAVAYVAWLVVFFALSAPILGVDLGDSASR